VAAGLKEDEAITAINVTPLVDVVLVLLVVFMATAHLISHRAMKLRLPEVVHSDVQDMNAAMVALGADSSLALNGKELTRMELMESLKQMTLVNPDLRVTLSADQGVSWGGISSVLDDLKGAGIERISADVATKSRL